MYDGELSKSTRVTFPGGQTDGESTIVAIGELPDQPQRVALFVETTPFHPVDHNWPDQPADQGYIVLDDQRIDLVDCLTAAYDQSDDVLYYDTAIPIKRGQSGWCFLVAHIIEVSSKTSIRNWLGKTVKLHVDPEYRAALSRGHTLCHLAALSLNRCLQSFWRKSPDVIDALGNYDFDRLTCQKSKIGEHASHDEYRLGKSLKKKGFNKAECIEALPTIQTTMHSHLTTLARLGVKVDVVPAACHLDEPRTWHSTLPEGEASIPCGGSHVQQFQMDEKHEALFVHLEMNDAQDTLNMDCQIKSKT